MSNFKILLLIVFLLAFNQISQAQPFSFVQTIEKFDTSDASLLTKTISVDLDSDLDNDLIVSEFQTKRILYIKNNGNGVFDEPIIISESAFGVIQLEVSDIDNDGDLDIFAACFLDSTIVWIENLGGDNFGPTETITDSVYGIISIAIEDINGDGLNDLASVSFNDHKIAWYANEGSGNFGVQQIIREDTIAPTSVNLVDLDGDNDNDLLLGIGLDGKIIWYKNDGIGNFSSLEEIYSSDNGIVNIQARDFDNDGNIDILYTNENSGELRVYKNSGNGTFNLLEVIPDIYNSLLYNPVNIFDFDNDGFLDLGYSFYYQANEYEGDVIGWAKNRGDGTFNDPLPLFRNFLIPSWIIANVNNDSNLDIVTFNSLDNTIIWMENTGDGIFSNIHPVYSNIIGIIKTLVADVDVDGIDDLITSSFKGNLNYIEYLSHDGASGFNSPSIIHIDTIFNNVVELADLDNDGDEDIIIASAIYESYFFNFSEFPVNGRIAWIENFGDGTFSNPITFSEIGDSMTTSILPFDIDNDNDLDILSVDTGTATIRVYNNDGNVNFTASSLSIPGFQGSTLLKSADLDGDGDLDLLSTRFQESELHLFYNNGNGSFGNSYLVPTNQGQPAFVDTADMDGDDDLDIIVSFVEPSKFAWYENDGSNAYDTEHIIDNQINGTHIFSVIDLNKNGNLDIIASKIQNNKLVKCYYNDGNGNLSNVETLSLLDSLNQVTFVGGFDVNIDGNTDVLVSKYEGLFWFRNLVEDTLTTVRGTVYRDLDQNNLYGAQDEGIPGASLKLNPGNHDVVANGNGEYITYLTDTGTYTLSTKRGLYFHCAAFSIDTLQYTNPNNGLVEFEFSPLDTIYQDFGLTRTDHCTEVRGIVFNDLNSNGIQDNNEPVLIGQAVAIANGPSTFTKSDGSYSFNVEPNLDIEIQLLLSTSNSYCGPQPPIYEVTFPTNPISYSFVVDSFTTYDTLDFGLNIQNQPAGIDLVRLYSLGVYNGNEPGETFNAYMDFKLNVENTADCILRIEHDPLLTLNNSSIPITNSGSNFIEWIFPSGTDAFGFCMQMNWTLDSSAVAGDTLHWEASYNCPPMADNCPGNNTIIRDVIIVDEAPGRFDGEAISSLYSVRSDGDMPETITRNDSILSYVTIFQNPLPNMAYDIVIIDTIPEYLDINSITRPFSSYPYDLKIVEPNVIIWEFDGINLPNQETDESNSYGFLQFNIKLKPNLAEGTIIPNSQSILFNSNQWAVTNEVIHRIEAISGLSNFDTEFGQVNLFPNPFGKEATLQFKSRLPFNYDLKIFDISGKVVRSYNNQTSLFDLTIRKNELPKGLYFLNLYNTGDAKISKSIKMIIQ